MHPMAVGAMKMEYSNILGTAPAAKFGLEAVLFRCSPGGPCLFEAWMNSFTPATRYYLLSREIGQTG